MPCLLARPGAIALAIAVGQHGDLTPGKSNARTRRDNCFFGKKNNISQVHNMPFRAGRHLKSRHKSRARRHAAGVIGRAWRKRKARRSRFRPTARKNYRGLRNLYKIVSDPKYNYKQLANVNVNSNTAWTSLNLSNMNQNLPPYDPTAPPGTTSPQYIVRELDSVQVRLKNIRIHMMLHVTPGQEAQRNQRYYVALLKTTNGIGSTLGISVPPPAAVFDSASVDTAAGSLLAPWEGFRVTQGPDGETLKSTTILKSWSGYLSPQGGDCMQNTQTVTATVPGTDITSTAGAGAGLNLNYTQDRPSQIFIKYTHKCMNALVKYESATSNKETNVKYALVALSMNSDTHQAYRINATCKVNFIDN